MHIIFSYGDEGEEVVGCGDWEDGDDSQNEFRSSFSLLGEGQGVWADVVKPKISLSLLPFLLPTVTSEAAEPSILRTVGWKK